MRTAIISFILGVINRAKIIEVNPTRRTQYKGR